MGVSRRSFVATVTIEGYLVLSVEIPHVEGGAVSIITGEQWGSGTMERDGGVYLLNAHTKKLKTAYLSLFPHITAIFIPTSAPSFPFPRFRLKLFSHPRNRLRTLKNGMICLFLTNLFPSSSNFR
jgi:hypothetical protein